MDNHSVSILIVDDDINYRKILSDFLKNEGYDVIRKFG
jgi:hypothetical protein